MHFWQFCAQGEAYVPILQTVIVRLVFKTHQNETNIIQLFSENIHFL